MGPIHIRSHYYWLYLARRIFSVEERVHRPLIPTRLWKTKGFTPLMLAYFLGFGCCSGSWQFYAVQFWLHIQHASSMTAALYCFPTQFLAFSLPGWLVERCISYQGSTSMLRPCSILRWGLYFLFLKQREQVE